jgi:hypothetical protein
LMASGFYSIQEISPQAIMRYVLTVLHEEN